MPPTTPSKPNPSTGPSRSVVSTCFLLKLPQELHDMIHEEAPFNRPESIDITQPTSLLRVNKQIHAEVKPILLKLITSSKVELEFYEVVPDHARFFLKSCPYLAIKTDFSHHFTFLTERTDWQRLDLCILRPWNSISDGQNPRPSKCERDFEIAMVNLSDINDAQSVRVRLPLDAPSDMVRGDVMAILSRLARQDFNYLETFLEFVMMGHWNTSEFVRRRIMSKIKRCSAFTDEMVKAEMGRI
ncbi:hypothetical protein EJ08DRAFT_21279 [Tothia fuscella]|uniref:F-box domain-containing protein n=1 Tax=Tothia fuscella TaxID=1048955 RepID=A0A9P4NZ59_9PEZI|nr:hypothetical protein EJ08DRAFT_21279 [Tothia fuscella]